MIDSEPNSLLIDIETGKCAITWSFTATIPDIDARISRRVDLMFLSSPYTHLVPRPIESCVISNMEPQIELPKSSFAPLGFGSDSLSVDFSNFTWKNIDWDELAKLPDLPEFANLPDPRPFDWIKLSTESKPEPKTKSTTQPVPNKKFQPVAPNKFYPKNVKPKKSVPRYGNTRNSVYGASMKSTSTRGQ